MKSSLEISEEYLRNYRDNDDLMEKLYMHPLQDMMLGLVDLLEAESAESQSLERRKGSRSCQIVYETASISDWDDVRSSMAPEHFDSPNTNDTPTRKRPISQTSFESRSTETTPNKLVQVEAKVQALQNSFVKAIINQLWLGQIGIPWARGRKMFLTYAEFSPFRS